MDLVEGVIEDTSEMEITLDIDALDIPNV